MERRLEAGESLDVHSVASFFVSRVDTEVDKRLAELGREDLRGSAAIANARAAYQSFKELFHGERFAALREAGAPVQRPLWASTGVKDPHYPDTKYVDDAGRARHRQHDADGHAARLRRGSSRSSGADRRPRTRAADLERARRAPASTWATSPKTLLREGIEKFVEPFDKLIAGIELTREAIVTGRPQTIESSLPDELEPRDDRARRAGADGERRAAHLGAATSRSGAAPACRRSPTASAG